AVTWNKLIPKVIYRLLVTNILFVKSI
ncbi:unnamed protein product, partial [Allacma fusca]